jgi:hypothetical protein
MFATLVGTNAGASAYVSVFHRLFEIALQHGFTAPNTLLTIRADGPIAGWWLEQKGPAEEEADFLLAVTAPRVPGISPIFPVLKTVRGPLFAAVVLDRAYLVSCEDRRDVSVHEDMDAVIGSFEEFLNNFDAPVRA